MNILVWSRYGDALSIARLMKEKDGNNVLLYIDYESNKEVGDGIVPKVDNWRDYIDWCDMIVVDDENQGEWVEELQNQGKVVFGTNTFGGKLENNRHYASEIMEKLGIRTIPHWEFETIQDTIDFIEEYPGRYVFKPFGQHPRYFTKIGEMKNGQDMIWFLKYLQKIWQGGQANQIQEYIEGIEVGLCANFSIDHFVKPYELNFEHKHMRLYGLGSNIGEAGTLQLFVNNSRIFDEIILPFEDYLKNTKYVGQFDINCKVNEEGIFPMEWTCRFGIPATYGYNEALHIRWSDFFWKCATGELEDGYAETDRFIVIVKLDLEPVTDLKEENQYYIPTRVPIFFDFDPIGAEPGFFEGDLIRDEQRQYYVVGKQGHIGVVIGSGETVQEAQDSCYKIVQKIYSPFSIVYNPEIGDKYEYIESFLKKMKII